MSIPNIYYNSLQGIGVYKGERINALLVILVKMKAWVIGGVMVFVYRDIIAQREVQVTNSFHVVITLSIVLWDRHLLKWQTLGNIPTIVVYWKESRPVQPWVGSVHVTKDFIVWTGRNFNVQRGPLMINWVWVMLVTVCPVLKVCWKVTYLWVKSWFYHSNNETIVIYHVN